jgi:hypothetical protein
MDRFLPPPILRAVSEMAGPPFLVASVAFIGIVTARWLYRFLRKPEHGTSRLPLIAIQAPVGLLMALSLVPAISFFAGFLAVKNTEGNIKKIATAMTDGYAADHDRRLPPQAIRDDVNGTPLLSWRVTILPYLGHEDLYREFHLNEPWDSSHNIQLLKKMPREYEGNFLVQKPQGHTCFKVFTGFNTAFAMDGYRVPDDFRLLGPSNTFLVVEATDPVPWTKPEDIAYPYPGLPRMGAERPKGLLGIYPSTGFIGAMVDCSVRGRLNITDPEIKDEIERDRVTLDATW